MTSRARLPVVLVAAATLLAVSLWPAPVAAQRRAVPRATRPKVTRPVVVRPRAFVGRTFYSRPLFWGPYGWGFGSSLYWGYGGYGFYPYQRPFGYPFYGPRYLASSIRVQVTPKTAEVFVDGYYAGIVDDFDGTFQRLNLEPGQHEVVVWAQGYRSIRQKLHLEPGRNYRIAETMVQLPPGEATERRPEPPPEGERRSEPFYGPGQDRPYPPYRPGREPVPDRPGRERPGGETRPAQESGELLMRIQPAGATVLIDGEEWQGPEDARLTVRLSPGEHKVVVSAEGYQTFETRVWVTAGESVTLNVSLLKN